MKQTKPNCGSLGMKWGDLPLRVKGIVVLCLPLVVLLLNNVSTYFLDREQQSAQHWVIHTLNVRVSLEHVLATASTASATCGMYPLTREEKLLSECRMSAGRLRKDVGELQALTADNPIQQRNIVELRRAVDDRIGYVLRVNDESKATLIAARFAQRKLLQVVNKMDAEEASLLTARTARLEKIRILSFLGPLAFLGGIAGGLIGVWVFLTGISRRIAVLEQQVTLVADGRPVTAADTYKDEIGAVALGLSRTSQLLMERERALSETNAQLVEQRERAEQASQKKSDFLARMSHELRTPMNAICGMAHLLWDSPLTEEQREYVRVYRKNSERLVNLVNDILDLSKVESEHLDLAHTDFDLMALLDKTLTLLGPFELLMEREKALFETNAQLVEQRERAEQANQTKSDFLARMSHEIRTPMNAICGMADLLWESPLTEQQREYVRVFRNNSERLLNLINDILDLSKIEGGYLDLDQTDFDLAALLDETMDLLRPLAHRKGLALAYRLEEDVPTALRGDPHRLQQILVNLVGNAIKFTEYGEIVATVERHDNPPGTLRFRISDTGPGIHPDQAGRIFEPFVQADSSMTRKTEGTGLGLAISKRLVERMGGTIAVESEPGKGSTFWFTVQLEQQPQPQAANAAEMCLPAPKQTPLQKIRILAADDSKDNRFLIDAYLEPEGYELDFAEDGVEAVEKAKTRRYDLILMDVQMPGKDGYTATREIRAWELENSLPAIPIITVTAHALKGEEARSRQAGSSAYLSKPIAKTKLISEIQHLTQAQSATAGAGAAQLSPEIQARVPTYLARRREEVRKIPKLLEEGDFEAIRVLAHNLKGTGAGYGFPELSQVGNEIEKAAIARAQALIEEHTASLHALLSAFDTSSAKLAETR